MRLAVDNILYHENLFLNSFAFNSHRFLLQRPNSFAFTKTQYEVSKQIKYSVIQVSCRLVANVQQSLQSKTEASRGEEFLALPYVQTLWEFPREKLLGKVVMVRFDSRILPQGENVNQSPPASALSTIKYLHEAGAKVILVSSWSVDDNSRLVSSEVVADSLSSMLELKVVPLKFVRANMEESDVLLLENLSNFKEERANCSDFAKDLTSGVDIFVNDDFSQSYRILASTVGVTSFCYASIAGFHFEEGLSQLKKITQTIEKPYIAIISGGNLAGKAAALRSLTSTCDGLVFVGSLAFHIMHALGVPIPMKFLETGGFNEAIGIIELAKSRKIPITVPKDFWCENDDFPDQLEIFSADAMLDDWQPVDIGPVSVQEATSLLPVCKKILWIGPLRFCSSRHNTCGVCKLAEAVGSLSPSVCDITFIGKTGLRELLGKSNSLWISNVIENASVVWECLNGRKLHGLMALDRAYPFYIDWSAAFADPAKPLVVDIGSGNGLFIFGMAKKRRDLNFLGLEMNEKLVNRCLENIQQSGICNGYFITTNATSTFHSIVSSYPGELVLVTIQCPNPDFNRPDYRWRMLQRSLVEAIADLLTLHGKVFLQSDIETVALRMIKEFQEYGQRKLVVTDGSEDAPTYQGEWLMENPFGVRTDWEQHVLDRGDPMYRILFSKLER